MPSYCGIGRRSVQIFEFVWKLLRISAVKMDIPDAGDLDEELR
jgi:hypothetical protein